MSNFNKYDTPAFAPVVASLGQFNLAWNDVQEACAVIFSTVMQRPPVEGALYDNTAFRIWHTVKSDRAQRAMLSELLKEVPFYWEQLISKNEIDDLKWCLNQIEKIENDRNNIIHSPLIELGELFSALVGQGHLVRPNRFGSRNPRAVQLFEKGDLASEFLFCRNRCIVLSDYLLLAGQCLVNKKSRLWPARPQMPGRPIAGASVRAQKDVRRPRL